MREFFQGWRRKTGLALLAVAMLLTVGWFRSFIVTDQIVVKHQHTLHLVQSQRSRVGWEWWTDIPISWDSDDPIIKWNTAVDADVDEIDTFDVSDSVTNRWRLQWGGFDIGAGSFEHPSYMHRIWFWVVPYWVLVLPLTLLSAFLIFSKPRQPKSAKEPKRV